MTKRILESSYSQLIEQYIDQRIANGFEESSFEKLYQFDAFLYGMNYTDKELSKSIIDLWCCQKDTEGNNNQIKRINTVKHFCIYLNFIGIKAYVPKNNIKKIKKVPYVMSKEEIILFFGTVDRFFKNKESGLKHYQYMIPIIMRLYYLCGLRNGEACHLKKEHVLFDKNILLIKDAKNKKERMVYIDKEMMNLLKCYVQRLNKDIESVWLFPSGKEKKPISPPTICDYFSEMINICHIGNKQHHPTPHSLRHSYVVHRIDSWIEEGENIDEMIPYLSKQLGHTSISETYYYYHMISSSYDNIQKKDRNLYPKVDEYEE